MKNYKLFSSIIVLSIIGAITFNRNVRLKESTTEGYQLPLEFSSDDIAKAEYAKKRQKRLNGYAKADKPDKFMSILRDMKTRAGDEAPGYHMGYREKELSKVKAFYSNARTQNAGEWIERGPGNVPGRTRTLVIDKTDTSLSTWFAGSVGGGIWKTTDKGQSWVNLTPNLPAIAISNIIIAPSNKNIMYATTGEGYGASAGFIKGDGVLKSTDGGTTWSQLASTVKSEDFQNTNRIIVDPNDANILLVCTSNDPLWGKRFNSGILKSIDGGITWTKNYSGLAYVQQIISNPNDFNVQYAAVNGFGVVKSVDAGDTWSVLNGSNSMATGRIELAISPVDTDIVYASVAGSGVNSTDGNLYVSEDAGSTWVSVTSSDNVNFLGGQGWYDNTIVAHPFDKNIVYVGGVNLFKASISENTNTTTGLISFGAEGMDALGFVNFSADLAGGVLSGGEILSNQRVAVEVRFGPGLSQKAHRYTVNKRGAGVPDGDYKYEDYVDVPFEVWDITNNKQLMVGFRDQQEDGTFNLIEQLTDENVPANDSREYLYVNLIDYSEEPSSEMAQDGGMINKNMYFMWPILIEGSGFVWDADNLPESKISVNWGSVITKNYEIATVSDAYGQYDGNNSFSQTQNATTVEGIHPDHHYLQTVVTGEDNEFMFIDTNDGGIYYSNVATDPGIIDGSWTFAGNGYNTTQFYDVDKAPGESRYIGGSQDNGTWMSQIDDEGSATAQYKRSLGGDGFATIWHNEDPNLILGSIYNNAIYKSVNGGATFSNSVDGLLDQDDNAPFVTKISNSKVDPNVVYAVGNSGVWKSMDFGSTWTGTSITDGWISQSFIDVKVSDANREVVWAGSLMASGFGIFVSKDQANTFDITSNFTAGGRDMGQISGLATHPTEEGTAYVLFSYAEAPKIIKTTDFGQTWTDISGFNDGTTSTTGFPDVAVYDLLVFPQDTDKIWVGTEIGIFESTDNAVSWHKLSGAIPSTSIWDLKIVDDQVVVGTHGRGIWSMTMSDIPTLVKYPEVKDITNKLEGDLSVNVHLKSDLDSMVVYDNENNRLVAFDGIFEKGDHTLSIPKDIAKDLTKIKVYGYGNGLERKSYAKTVEYFAYEEEVTEYATSFESVDEENNFRGDLFNVKLGVDDLIEGALHSEHPYQSNQILYTYFNKLIKVKGTDATIKYEDIALVTSSDFVTVEGTVDGSNWIEMITPYNSEIDDNWSAYVKFESNPTADLFKQQTINLLDYFAKDDLVAIRFKLTSSIDGDGAYGWVINNLDIQGESERPTSSLEDLMSISSVKIGPTEIVDGKSTLFVNTSKKSNINIEIFDLQGKLLSKQSLGIFPLGNHSIPFTVKNYNEGIMIAVIDINGTKKSFKLIGK